MSGDTVRIDEHGDVYLRVGCSTNEETRRFLVCSRTLRRTSAVFEELLRMPAKRFGEDVRGSILDPTTPRQRKRIARYGWHLHLPHDSPSALEIALNLAHSNVSRLPRELNSSKLNKLLITTSKYGITNLAWSYIDSMIDWHSKDTIYHHFELMSIAWQLGDEERFCEFANKVILYSKKTGRTLVPNIFCNEGEDPILGIPPGFLGKIPNRFLMLTARSWTNNL